MESGFASRFISGIDANRTIKDELTEALRRQRGRRRISVTDLVNPRQAFFRWTHPEIQPSPDRLQVMLAGTGFHDLFGKAVSTEEYLEQFVEMDGIVGKIDIYDEVPAELKTSGSIPDDLQASRPGYIDQLGMYCAMTAKAEGHLVIYRRALYGRPPGLKAFNVLYKDLDAIRAEMARRRDLFREALDSGDPTHLPCCEWFSVGCDYREICGCDGVTRALVVARDAAVVVENEGLAKALSVKLAHPVPRQSSGFKLNDLVFPRKAALERQPAAAIEEEPDSGIETSLVGIERQGFHGALYQALRFGVPGAFTRSPIELRTLKGWVGTYKALPTILRATRTLKMVERERLGSMFSHYFDRLAFECALSGHDRGRVVIYYEALEGEKFMVYDVWFKDRAAILAEAERRLALLETGAPPSELPACPAWMAKFCRFAPGCGCDGA